MNNDGSDWFQTERIRDDLFCITEAHYSPAMRANIWLVKGRDAYLMIESLSGNREALVATKKSYGQPGSLGGKGEAFVGT